MDKVRNTSSLGDLSDIFSKLNVNSPNKKEIMNSSTEFISSIQFDVKKPSKILDLSSIKLKSNLSIKFNF
jgi:hypothetical protein